jgi:hypothetical protein
MVWVRNQGSGIRDPGSEILKQSIPDPGVKKAPDPGSGSATLVKDGVRLDPVLFLHLNPEN